MAQQKVKEEKQHHKEAFEIYFLLPPEKRSIREVARRLKKAPSTVQSWAESFDWKERVTIREAQVSRQFQEVQKQNNDTLVESKATFYKILKALIAEAIEDIKKKKLKIESVNDLHKVMTLALDLLGEEDRKAQGQLNDFTQALQASVQMFGGQAAQWTYDGNDRIEDDSNDDSAED
jgi:hypothetical protein